MEAGLGFQLLLLTPYLFFANFTLTSYDESGFEILHVALLSAGD